MIDEVLRTKYTTAFVFCWIIFLIGIILTNNPFQEERRSHLIISFQVTLLP